MYIEIMGAEAAWRSKNYILLNRENVRVNPFSWEGQYGIWRLASRLLTKEVMTMSDYEILAIIILVITLAFTIHIGSNHK